MAAQRRLPADLDEIAEREEVLKEREANAAHIDARIARDKAATCKEYSRRLDDIRKGERRGGDARLMEHLSEMRRRIQAAQFSKGC